MWCGLASTRIVLLVAGLVLRLGIPRVRLGMPLVLGIQFTFVDGSGAVSKHVAQFRERVHEPFKDEG